MGYEQRAKQKRKHVWKLPNAGIPGHQHRLVMVPIQEDVTERQRFTGGTPGKYLVVFTLRRPERLPVAEREFSFDPTHQGDSHIAMAPPAITFNDPKMHAATAVPNVTTTLRIETEANGVQVLYECFANKLGFMGRVETTLHAQNVADAEQQAYRGIAPALSHWATVLDVPVIVWRIYVKELASGAEQISAKTPYPETTLRAIQAPLSEPYTALIGFYREAVNATSPIYEYLCLFKIAEAIRTRHDLEAARAIANGAQPQSRPRLRIPATETEFVPWLNAIYPGRQWDDFSLSTICVPEALGRKINNLLQKELLDVRNDIAHALSEETGNVKVSMDELLHVSRVERWLPLMKCIARLLLQTEFPTEMQRE